MSVAHIKKVIIASHCTEARQLLEALQEEGIIQILDAARAMISKEWPELHTEPKKTREIEDTVKELEEALVFLKGAMERKQTLAEALAPLTVVARDQYSRVASSEETLDILAQCKELSEKIESLSAEYENTNVRIGELWPWESMATPLEQIYQLDKAVVLAGRLAERRFEQTAGEIAELGGAIEGFGLGNSQRAFVVICLDEAFSSIQKVLRAADFEQVNFSGLCGTAAELIQQNTEKLRQLSEQIAAAKEQARDISEHQTELQILCDHYRNLLSREQTRLGAPETEQVVLLEGWVKSKDFGRLEKVVAKFESSSISEMELTEGEEVPIEIENNRAIKPFETITRLHGMPTLGDVDPTAFLAPFFALFFGLCLTDAGYGIVLAVALWWLMKKFQGDKKALWMFFICSICTIVAGALTGGWFGDAFQTLIPQLSGFREKLMLFDPMKDPMIFFMISMILGYVQIMFALFIGFFNNLSRKDYATAVFNFLAWIIFLNSLVLLGLSKAVTMPEVVGKIAGWIAISQAILIFCFSERKSGMAGRIGGGVFSLFSTVFYFGDVLSYVRLMALGMVTAGLGIAVNILVELVMEVPYGIGYVLGALLFVGGHTMNLALSVLSSFVHSLRLQFVEFFPKFFTGGGKEFNPLSLSFKHLIIKTEKNVSK